MSQTLTYTIINSQLVSTEREIKVDGAPATIKQARTVVEAQPVDQMGKTFSAVLSADAVDDFPEGATLTVTLAIETETPDNG